MATHSSILAWEIPWTEEPGRLQSTGSQRVRHDWATKQQHQQKERWLLVLFFRLQCYSPFIGLEALPEMRWQEQSHSRTHYRSFSYIKIILKCCGLVMKSCLTLCDSMGCSMPGCPVLHYLPKFAQTHVCWVTDAIQPSHPLSPSSITFNPSQHQGLFQELVLHKEQPKYWSFSISPSDEYSGFIYFKIDWFYLLPVQGTLKSLLQHRNLKAVILWCSAFFLVQLSHPYRTTEKTIALTIHTDLLLAKWYLCFWIYRLGLP